MNKIFPFAIILGCAAIIAVAFSSCGKHKDQSEQQEMSIDVAYPEVDSITLYKVYPATVRTRDVTDVVGRVDGIILSQQYQDGSHVSKGQVLFVIESAKYKDAVQQAESSLATARAEYAYASKQYEAMKKALQSDAVSQMDVAQAKSNMEQAAASIKNSTAALQTARTNLSYCTVRAPISGIASAAVLDPGAYVNGGASPVVLCTIYDDNAMSVRFHVEDSEYEAMLGKNGGINNPLFRKVPVSFTNPLPHDYFIDLSYESPAIDPTTGTLLIKGRVKNINDELKDGMYCKVHLPYGTDSKAILVRDASIGTDQLGKYVYVVNDSNKVVYTHIEIGDLYRDSLRVVTKGLTPKQRYVTKALLKVREGETVKPVLQK
ncbi:MAG: efflux RND transporter periplasmic adaptor subunit [Clostridium sp.]|nr:efflux RND transporter periplasmic adaptor subunit [Prevotella sp.]MCM1429651.1 efflux RND transporter periplasmic adaptor subunit [Clostridium sp.]MCM1474653.1 efflux RND transporter periplasmic adaptor subunit [Muribaculaceae bacterium]